MRSHKAKPKWRAGVKSGAQKQANAKVTVIIISHDKLLPSLFTGRKLLGKWPKKQKIKKNTSKTFGMRVIIPFAKNRINIKE